MDFSKNFLYQALNNPTFQYGQKVLGNEHDALWQQFDQTRHVNVSIDSRSIQPGEFFIAIKGLNFDGHDFVKDALARGASGALIQRDRIDSIAGAQEGFFIIVDDTMQSFTALAKAWRQRLTCPVVGITGSVGKTSTKEMVRSILLAAGIDAYVSFKNFNNIFGLCYNILRIPLWVQAAVFEVGINEKGEMEQLADILRPTIGLITNIGHAHLEGLGNSLGSVASEKRQLFKFFSGHDVGIVFGDQPLLSDISYVHPIAKFGLKTKNQVQARKVVVCSDEKNNLTTKFFIKWYGKKAAITLKTNHQAMVINALAASAVAYFLNVSFEAVVKGLEEYQGFEHRFEMKKLRDGKGMLLNDCYNANPESMKAAIVAFSQLTSKGLKIAVLGDMLELGDREAYWHRQIGRVLAKVGGCQHLILVGQRARGIAHTAPRSLPVIMASDWQEAHEHLEKLLAQPDALVLVKASHGIHLERMVSKVVE